MCLINRILARLLIASKRRWRNIDAKWETLKLRCDKFKEKPLHLNGEDDQDFPDLNFIKNKIEEGAETSLTGKPRKSKDARFLFI